MRSGSSILARLCRDGPFTPFVLSIHHQAQRNLQFTGMSRTHDKNNYKNWKMQTTDWMEFFYIFNLSRFCKNIYGPAQI
jgi:hypothetical protein